MAKQLIISVLEDVVGEYVLNVSKDNLKLAAMRGKVKLENVQLDGELIGSHVLGAVGLSGFGVLSCWAKAIKMSAPLGNFEREPARCELYGVHLVCVPLLPSTAHKQYGTGTSNDPRCSLRTRAKRSALARFERNFFGGRIPGEGPPNRRIKVALRRAERALRTGKYQKEAKATTSEADAEFENLSNVLSELDDNYFVDSGETDSKDEIPEELLQPQQGWKGRLREKVLRNLQFRCYEMHIRCEVAERGLEFSTTTASSRDSTAKSQLPADQRAFAFGLAIESMTMRADDGTDPMESSGIDSSSSYATQQSDAVLFSLSSAENCDYQDKFAQIKNASIYWDDEPLLLISETAALRKVNKLSPTKLQARIAAAMDAMVSFQDPGMRTRLMLGNPELSATSPMRRSTSDCPSTPHHFIVKSFNADFRVKLGDRHTPGPMRLIAEVLPASLSLSFRPHQLMQYQTLKSAMMSQHRFDTMLRQRPRREPSEDPRLWWRYAISCVTSRPNSRPWADVAVIVKSRAPYMQLVKKKLLKAAEGSGFHGGLDDQESDRLLHFEDLLPIEVLQAFHLLALREVYDIQKIRQSTVPSHSNSRPLPPPKPLKSRGRGTGGLQSLKKLIWGASKKSKSGKNGPKMSEATRRGSDTRENQGATRELLLHELSLRLGKKRWFTTFILNDAKIRVNLLQGDEGQQRIVCLELGACGLVRTFGIEKRELAFDILQCDVYDCLQAGSGFRPSANLGDKLLMFDAQPQPERAGEQMKVPRVVPENSALLSLPPPGVVCSISISKDLGSLALSVSAHPATVVWNQQCIKAVSEFFTNPSSQLQTDVTRHLRNVATPLARKAVLALLSPSAITLRVNISAPKLWFPVSSHGDDDGAVFLDAGKVKLNCTKEERGTDLRWNVGVRDIQIKFDKSPQSMNSTAREISVLRPFHIKIGGNMLDSDSSLDLFNGTEPTSSAIRVVDVIISPICLNLVDAEILARAIGKWYAFGLGRVKKRARQEQTNSGNVLPSGGPDHSLLQIEAKQLAVSSRISVTVSKVEIALEGHSRSLLYDIHPDKRTYLVDFFNIQLRRTTQSDTARTSLVIEDATITQIVDASLSPSKYTSVSDDLKHCILVRLERDRTLDASGEHVDDGHEVGLSPFRKRTTKNDSADISFGHASLTSFARSNNDQRRFDKPIVAANLLHDGIQHLDEVEIDAQAFIVRVTPTSLKDCAKGLRRVLELVQLVTKEMERKVHEGGRKARQRQKMDQDSNSSLRPITPTLTDIESDFPGSESLKATDSSILFKVTLQQITLQAGRPIQATDFDFSNATLRQVTSAAKSNAVVQVVTNALIMFQSIENPDGSGNKTLHLSLDNLAAKVMTEFAHLHDSATPPMVGPTSAEFRIVYATANLGCVVSQDVSLDCEATTACMTLADVYVMACVVQKMSQRLRSFEFATHKKEPFVYPEQIQRDGSKIGARRMRNFVRYKKKGTGIATSVRMEIQNFSVVLLQAYRSRKGARPFFDISMKETKARFEGCLSALSGEGHAVVAMKHYNFDLGEWQDAVEETLVSLVVDQMPNELILKVLTNEQIQMNITGAMLKDAASLDLSIFWRTKASPYGDDVLMDSKSLASVGLRRATESTSISFMNETGLDLLLSLPYTESDRGDPPVDINCRPGVRIPLNGRVQADFGKRPSIFSSEVPALVVKLARSAIAEVGPRHALANLPIFSESDHSATLHKLQPAVPSPETSTFKFNRNGRHSPETVLSETSAGETLNSAYYGAEPVVEWCMQNQRLRASIIDVYSLETGRDLLSSAIWSPEDEINDEPDRSTLNESDILGEDVELTANGKANSSPSRRIKPVTSTRPGRSNWVRPYLKDDSPEWTDMTCILRMARDRVMLPDNNWIWLNDWTVDLSAHEREADFDGWEYEADFETFNRNRRFYKRGDSCRRRRWTRTRMVRPPSLHDPYRPVSLVWETVCDEDGNQLLVARSHVTINNHTGTPLSVFVSSPSWKEENLGRVETGKKLRIPIHLACATFLRLGTLKSNAAFHARSSESYFLTRKIVIVPTGHTASTLIRASVARTDGFEEDVETLHLLVNVASCRGIVDVHIQPVLRVTNLLPCELQVELSEVVASRTAWSHDVSRPCVGTNGKKVSLKDRLKIGIGKAGRSVRVDPARKPHLSLRVPGYRWSPWHRIVNRRASSHTWQPSECEVESQMPSASGDTSDHADEFKTIIHFERHGGAGDPLAVIVSIEEGHCPTIRVYAQYWILDKTGFGCRFCDGFLDMLGTQPDTLTSRRSHLLGEESKHSAMQDDKSIRGHQWSMGMNGMSLFFSERERIALSIERGSSALSFVGERGQIRSKWVSPLDISNVIPKTVFSVDELAGSRRFELAVSVTVCPGEFSRSRLITLFPRYQIVNLLNTELLVAQDGCLETFVAIGPRSSSPYHWKNNALPPKVRLGSSTTGIAENDIMWTNGCIQLDKVGITSLRLPKEEEKQSRPMVVQVEVRLATKEQASAVTVVIWSTDEKTNPLYVLRNKTRRTIICRQPLHDDVGEVDENGRVLSDGVCGGQEMDTVTPRATEGNPFECGSEIGPILSALFGFEQGEEFVWVLGKDSDLCFGFDDPEKPHILEWTCARDPGLGFQKHHRKSIIEVDAMGSSATHQLSKGSEIVCQIRAEHSTKVIEFEERGSGSKDDLESDLHGLHKRAKHYEDMISSELRRASSNDREQFEDGEALALSMRVDLPAISLSVIDNATPNVHGREIMLAQFNWLVFEFAQNREGYHEVELLLTSLQVDNHVQKSIHPVLVFCPAVDRKEPLVHVSAVRRVQPHNSSLVFRYAAVRILEIEVYLDRRTVESIASFIEPIGKAIDVAKGNPFEWVSSITTDMARSYTGKDYRATRDIEAVVQTANSGRIYFEHLHLHPVRIGLTFTQEWMEWKSGGEGLMIFHFIRGMTSIANAPLKFTSFMVGNAFESPQSLVRIVATHYSSQLTKQIFGILGSLAILGAPADFISNVGSGVRDFFYEPINGMVHGPAQFLEGLEAGTQSLARGVFVGVVRGAANVTEVVNANLAGLTADSDFIDERKAHQRMLTDAMSRGVANRTIGDSLYLAGASVARGVRSGAVGIWEQPAMYASKHGPVGFVKGMGKALVGAIVKPVVGVGDAAVLVMNHVSDATSDKQVLPKIPKRLRRALPRFSAQRPCSVRIVPYDDRAAKAQKIVTGGESVDDIYVGHANLETHLIIASEECLWAIDRRSREPWCISWEEISHFGIRDGNKMRITVFSQTGLKSHVFHVVSETELAEFYKLLVIQLGKMGNGTNELSELDSSMFNGGLENISRYGIPGIKARQSNHVFGSVNKSRKRLSSNIKDEIDVIEQCFARVKGLGSESPKFFQTLDDEAWTLINSWGQVFSGLSSRRCIAAGIINGTGFDVQIKSSKLVEGGSPCYSIPTKEFDSEQGVLRPGGAIIFFGWGVVPNLLQPGNVFMNIETNAFVSDLSYHKSRDTYAQALPDFQVGFLEKSYDESGWWAKYWILVRRAGW